MSWQKHKITRKLSHFTFEFSIKWSDEQISFTSVLRNNNMRKIRCTFCEKRIYPNRSLFFALFGGHIRSTKSRLSRGQMVLLNLSRFCWGIPKGACPLWVRVVKKSQTFQIPTAVKIRFSKRVFSSIDESRLFYPPRSILEEYSSGIGDLLGYILMIKSRFREFIN